MLSNKTLESPKEKHKKDHCFIIYFEREKIRMKTLHLSYLPKIIISNTVDSYKLIRINTKVFQGREMTNGPIYPSDLIISNVYSYKPHN